MEVIPKAVSGYYSGFNLDYEIRIDGSDSLLEDITENIENYPEDYGISQSTVNLHYHNIESWLELELEKLTDVVEDVFKKVSTPLNVVARFSNGETMYEKA